LVAPGKWKIVHLANNPLTKDRRKKECCGLLVSLLAATGLYCSSFNVAAKRKLNDDGISFVLILFPSIIILVPLAGRNVSLKKCEWDRGRFIPSFAGHKYLF